MAEITDKPEGVVAPKNVEIGNPRHGKKMILIGIAFMLAGIVLVGLAAGKPAGYGGSIGGIFIIVGIILLVYGKIQHWYHNK